MATVVAQIRLSGLCQALSHSVPAGWCSCRWILHGPIQSWKGLWRSVQWCSMRTPYMKVCTAK